MPVMRLLAAFPCVFEMLLCAIGYFEFSRIFPSSCALNRTFSSLPLQLVYGQTTLNVPDLVFHSTSYKLLVLVSLHMFQNYLGPQTGFVELDKLINIKCVGNKN